MNEISVSTKKRGVEFLLNPENGKWIFTNNPKKYRSRISGDIHFRPLKGTHLVLFNVGRECNLRCKYCFVGKKRDEKATMSLKTAKKALKRVSEMKEGVKKIVFHGSEPLLNFHLIKDIVAHGKATDKEIKYSIQTNGTLLTPDIIDFLVKNEVYIGFSLDGTKESHNQMRPFINGKGSYDLVIKNLSQVREQQGKASFISVITKYNVKELDKIVKLAKELDIQNISFNPVFSTDSSIAPKEQELADNLIRITECYFSDLLSNVKTPRLDHPKRYLSTILHTDKYSNSCLQCGAGPSNPLIAVDVDGTLYPCDHFWGERNYAIGHIDYISLDEASSSLNNFRNNRGFKHLDDCISCKWKRICSGGCPGGRIISGKAQYCETTDILLTYFIERIPLLKDNGLLSKLLT